MLGGSDPIATARVRGSLKIRRGIIVLWLGPRRGREGPLPSVRSALGKVAGILPAARAAARGRVSGHTAAWTTSGRQEQPTSLAVPAARRVFHNGMLADRWH